MDALNILRELRDLIESPDADTEDMKRAVDEALYIFGRDKTVELHFKHHFDRVKPLLPKLHEDRKGKSSLARPVPLIYFLREFLQDLEERYKVCLLSELSRAILETKDEQDIYHYTGTLLTRLIDEGHSIEGLYGIVYNLLMLRPGATYDFGSRFGAVQAIITRPHCEYEVVFKVGGFRKLEAIPPEFGGLRFARDVNAAALSYPTPQAESDVRTFLTSEAYPVYARIRVTAQEDRAAGMKAKEQLDSVFDLMRFELAREVVSASQEFIAIRCNEGSARVFALPSNIPNPMRAVRKEEFEAFVNLTSRLLASPSMDRETGKRVRSALRFYRMGRDSETHENKLLNWWTALEYLCRTGRGGGIGEGVERRLTAVLVLNYVRKHLESVQNTLSYCEVTPTSATSTTHSVESYPRLSPVDFFNLLRDPAEVQHMLTGLVGYPSVRFAVERLIQETKDVAAIALAHEHHQQNVKWHVHRLYRVRCDIAHSASYSIDLTLLCASLEYYLKAVIGVVLDELNTHPSVEGLTELFDRIDHRFEGVMTELKAKNESSFLAVLRHGII